MDSATTSLIYLLAWFILYIVFRISGLEKRGLTAKPLYFIYRSTRLNKALEKLARRGRMFWRVSANIGIAFGVGLMILAVYSLARGAFALAFKTPEATPVSVLVPLPGLTISWENSSYIMVAVVILAVTHELAHGIASLIDGIPLKSAGIFSLLFLTAAFVEIDDQKLEKTGHSTRLRVFAAGSFVNLATWLLVLILMYNFVPSISPFYDSKPSGVLITDLVEGGAAQTAGIEKWDVIYAFNGTAIAGYEGLSSYLLSIKPNSHLVAWTNRGALTITTRTHPSNSSRPYLGVSVFNYYAPKLPIFSVVFPFQLYQLERWMATIMIAIALFNMLPIFPFDGDKFLVSILKAFNVGRIKEMRTLASMLCLFIIGLNFALSLWRYGSIQFLG
jgi:membrane-associated protease RseP (regulator of RpoE activity)